MTQADHTAAPKNEQQFHSRWLEGSKAARAGQPVTANPYIPENYMFVAWLNGWSFTRHQIANEEEL